MMAIVIILLLIVAAIIALFLYIAWDGVDAGDLTFVLSPLVVALFLFGRWHGQLLPTIGGFILLLVAAYSAYRVYRSYRRGGGNGS